MSNMSYCRFENTLNDLLDCKEALENVESKLSSSEAIAAVDLIKTCEEIVNYIKTETTANCVREDDLEEWEIKGALANEGLIDLN